MVRWSKEPRRISVVEGRVAASLARDLRTVSCFIYNNETIKSRFCQAPCGHGRVNFPYAAKRGPAGGRGSDGHGTFSIGSVSGSPSASLRCADIMRDLDYRRDNSPRGERRQSGSCRPDLAVWTARAAPPCQSFWQRAQQRRANRLLTNPTPQWPLSHQASIIYGFRNRN